MIVLTVVLRYPILGQFSLLTRINLIGFQSIRNGGPSTMLLGTTSFHMIIFVPQGRLAVYPELALWLPTCMSN